MIGARKSARRILIRFKRGRVVVQGTLEDFCYGKRKPQQ
jgi:hypothetical protein